MSNSASNQVLWLVSIKAFKGSINLALWSIIQFGHKYWLKSRKICQSKFVDWLKSWKQFQLFDWCTASQPSKFLKLKISHLNFWIDRETVINFHLNGNYPSQKIDWKKIWILQEIKLYSSAKTIWQLNYTFFRVFVALGQFGETEPIYTESNAKYSAPHLTPNEVFRLISVQTFQVMDLFFAISFSISAWTFMKK